ncbi:MAG: pilus assembly FimT family protein [Gemmatimonadales bacterium]
MNAAGHPGGSSTRTRPWARAGLTLIELLVVIAVIGIISAFALPKFNLEGYKVNSAVRAVTATLSYSQRLAVTLQHDVRVAIDQPNDRLRIHEDLNNNGVMDAGERVTYTNLEEGVIFGMGTAPPVTYTDGTQGMGVVNLVGTQAGLPVIVFRRDGSASEAGGFYLNTVRGTADTTNNAVRAGEIIRSSGRVVWYTYASSAWTRGN